jgi:long-chain acyl-CoA synthetase
MNLSNLLDRVAKDGCARIVHFYDGRWQTVDSQTLCRHVDETCARLRHWGIAVGHRIGIQASNCYQWILHDLALLRLGAVSVALPEHFDSPPEELAATHDLDFLLIGELDDKHPERPWIARLMTSEQGPKAVRRPSRPPGDPDVFTMVASSGTSGVIKTLMISKQGVNDDVVRFTNRFPMDHRDRITIFLPLSNLQQRNMVFGALWFGLELVVSSPTLLFRSLKEQPPTLFVAPPMFYEAIHRQFLAATTGLQRLLVNLICALLALLPQALAAPLRRRLFAPVHRALGGRIRWMITGMAHIRHSTLRFFARSGLPLFEAYGLTESGLVAGNGPGANRRGSVGRPFDPGSVVVAADGEIIVKRSHRVATSYWKHDPEETARVFPDSETTATGDLGRFDRAGYLYLTGRKKEIIVTAGGVKVQPEELERVIRECPGVEHCAVVGAEALPHLIAVLRMTDNAGPEQKRAVEEVIAGLNRRQVRGAEIRQTIWADVPFTADNGMLTRNLKLNRRQVFARFGAAVSERTGAA